MPVFDRLIGLETEYAVRFQPDPADSGPERAERPSNYDLFDALVAQLRRHTPVARARHFKKGFFTANGGAVWFEKVRQATQSGLVEGTTPECRGPRQLLAYQRAQDAWLADAAQDALLPGVLTLVKNDRDARGRVFGAHENYEVRLPPDWRLTAWRRGVLLLLPLVVVSWAVVLALVFAVAVCYLASALLYPLVVAAFAVLRPTFPRLTPDAARSLMFGRDFDRLLKHGDEYGAVFPPWLEPPIYLAEHLLLFPLGMAVLLLARLTLWRDLRRQLLPFLASRSVVCGSGRLERDGAFHVASKATGLTCVSGLNGFHLAGDRPIFSFGHLVKTIFLYPLHYGGAWRGLRADRQRLQICLGDSNMCEEAEYLRVGTTLLVLDAIEAGFAAHLPGARRPLRALHRIATDPTLTAKVKMSDGVRRTAVEIQRRYLDACRRYLDSQTDVPEDAWDVLSRWEDVLDRLEAEPESLVGRVDWITKRWLLEECGPDAPWEVRKKIDIRYHELSPDGYFRQLQQTGLTETILSPDELDRAARTPPPNTRAAVRGRYIREFAQGGDLQANWDAVTIGTGPDARTIELSRYGNEPPSGPVPA